jgi:hypothetical protein
MPGMRPLFLHEPLKCYRQARVAAGPFGFLIFSHAFDGPDL